MKKTFGKVVAFAMIASIFAISIGCSSNRAVKQSYKAGSYTAAANGRNGPVELAVTFSDDTMTGVKIVNSKETEGLGTVALDKLSNDLIKYQSLNLDVVSGATFTTVAFTEAVAKCVQQAGGDVNALRRVAKPKKPSATKQQITTDLVIIGGGASGMTASIRARQLGLNVVLLEKQSFVGGAILISGAAQVLMGSKLQKAAGVTNDSVEIMVADFKKNGSNLNVDELITLYASNVGAATDWLVDDVGVKFETKSGLTSTAEYSLPRYMSYTGGSPGVTKTLREAMEKSGVKVMLNTRASKLITANGKITGVQATDDNNVEYTINSKAVLMATGGYGYNKDLLSDELKAALYYGPVSSTGDGLIMATAEGVNAGTRLLQYGKRYPNGIETSPGIAMSTVYGSTQAFNLNGILVNKRGKRIVDEKQSFHTLLDAMLAEPEGMAYIVMDADSFDAFRKSLAISGISETDITTWLNNNGKANPVFAHADTLAEAAKIAGIDAATLENTVNQFNGFVRSGNDAEFGRNSTFMKKEINKAPYYIVEQKPRFATTMGGLVINTSMQVQNTSGKIIEGLFACGEVVGGVMGDDSPPGANNAWATTSGKLAAESIAKNIKAF